MKLLKLMVLALTLTTPFQVFAADLGIVRLGLVEGDVQIYTPEAKDWESAELNTPLGEGDRIWVPEDGRAELQLKGGVTVRFDQNTSFDILALDRDEVHFYMDRGHAFINNPRGGVKIVQVDTPSAACNSYDNSIMLLDVDESGTTDVSALKGYLFVESRSGKTRVKSGNTLKVTGDGSAELAPVGPLDDWERWNLARDRELSSMGESSRYLPEELHEYSSDFDRNGRWSYVREYGYVWTPTVIVRDWVPYRHGRWRWVRNDYVWIPADPWGWAPSHYGRWAFIGGIGWSWVPPAAGAVYWGPGYVAWVRTDREVAWVPLAPGEVYYGRGYFGPNSVNVVTINVGQPIVRRDVTYINRQRAVTVVHSDDFARGKRIREVVRENPFSRPQVIVAPPPERMRHTTLSTPSRTVVGQPPTGVERKNIPSPAIRVGPSVSRPPERVQQITPEQIRMERKFARDRDQSVFRPDRPAPLKVRKLDEPRIIIRKEHHPKKGSPEGPSPEKRNGRDHEKKERGEGKNKHGD